MLWFHLTPAAVRGLTQREMTRTRARGLTQREMTRTRERAGASPVGVHIRRWVRWVLESGADVRNWVRCVISSGGENIMIWVER